MAGENKSVLFRGGVFFLRGGSYFFNGLERAKRLKRKSGATKVCAGGDWWKRGFKRALVLLAGNNEDAWKKWGEALQIRNQSTVAWRR